MSMPLTESGLPIAAAMLSRRLAAEGADRVRNGRCCAAGCFDARGEQAALGVDDVELADATPFW